ncbi:MAG TPA: chemotaxis protein CheB, partial [Vicinamibacterales bacterium]|nr:chemotaxis protein CheB [Vicinamibacterales bacterium]
MARQPRRSIAPRRSRRRRDAELPRPSVPEPAASIVGSPAPAGGDEHGAAPSDGVVAIGASAGGLEAFMQLLGALPADLPLSFVFIQHLSPQHESGLAGVLANRTSMPVLQAADGMPIEPRHIYVIPPNAQMAVRDGRLTLQPRPFDRTQFTPIDTFFQSLARWAHGRAIGVVLSGTASDGAAGIREIKSAGGITIAQRPESARYDGMPRAAISTGMVDLVLSPEEIAEHLGTLDGHPYLRRSDRDDETIASDEQLSEVFGLLRRVSGVDFKHYKAPTVRRRLLRRMALHRMSGIGDYVALLRRDAAEISLLYQDLLIHVTRFFRDPDSFSVLSGQVFPEIAREAPDDRPIRIWVPGCATGEEAYSIAIVLMEFLGSQPDSRRIQIFATDVSETAIDSARTGAYPLSISADVSAERLKRFFIKVDGNYRVNKSVRDVCLFARHDLTRDPPFSRLDLIVCRNVLIYLDTALQKRLVPVFHYALRPNGYLMLGPAETTGYQPYFTIADKRWRLFRKTAVDAPLPSGFSTERWTSVPLTSMPPPAPRGEGRTVQEEANRLLLQKFSPAGVIVDSGNQIVQFRGQTGPYLEPASGDPNLNVLKMAREGLLFSLRTALQSARRRHKPVKKDNVLVRRDGEWQPVTIEIVPLGGGADGHALVLFHERDRSSSPVPPASPRRRGGP